MFILMGCQLIDNRRGSRLAMDIGSRYVCCCLSKSGKMLDYHFNLILSIDILALIIVYGTPSSYVQRFAF